MEYANFFCTKLRKSAKLLKNDENGKYSQQQWTEFVKNYQNLSKMLSTFDFLLFAYVNPYQSRLLVGN